MALSLLGPRWGPAPSAETWRGTPLSPVSLLWTKGQGDWEDRGKKMGWQLAWGWDSLLEGGRHTLLSWGWLKVRSRRCQREWGGGEKSPRGGGVTGKGQDNFLDLAPGAQRDLLEH